jgi:hypothetical protein
LIGVAGLRRGGIEVVPGVPLAAARRPLRLPFHVHPHQGLVLAILLIDPRGGVEDHRPTLNRVNDMVSMEANSSIRWSFEVGGQRAGVNDQRWSTAVRRYEHRTHQPPHDRRRGFCLHHGSGHRAHHRQGEPPDCGRRSPHIPTDTDTNGGTARVRMSRWITRAVCDPWAAKLAKGQVKATAAAIPAPTRRCWHLLGFPRRGPFVRVPHKPVADDDGEGVQPQHRP